MELRPGYKQTEVGVIPEEWEPLVVGDVVSFSGGSQPPRSTFIFREKEGYVRLVQIRDYKTDDYATYIPEQLAKKKCTTDEIMIGRYGPPIFQILRGIEGAYNVALIKAIPSQKIDQEYLYYFLKDEKLFLLMDMLSQRSSGQTGVELPALKAYPCPLPPLPEQRAIAAALSDVDALIASLDKLIAKKRDMKQAAMQELLTGKRRLPGFSGEWEVRRLGEIADIDPENLGSSTCPEYTFKYISLEDVDTGSLRGWTEQLFKTAPSRARRKLRKNDVLVSTVRPNLKSHLFIRTDISDLICSTGFSVVRCKPSCTEPAYIFAHLFADGIDRQIESLLTGSNYPAINSGDVKALQIPLPPLPEQTAIATILSDMDAEIAELERKRDKTRLLKQGMMQELLTGRIRLV
jgi:type I restriction enzyme S subunit